VGVYSQFAVLAVALTLPLCAEDHLKYGHPSCSGPVLDKEHFVICHDGAQKIPAWVGYALTRADLAHPAADRDSFQFRSDAQVPRPERAFPADYTNSGYDRGHMAPAADFKRSVEALRSTFVLSNAVPQRHGINAGQWSRLEAAVRALADGHGKVWVFSGPLFVGKRPLRNIGRGRVAVSTHTFKVILCVHQDDGKEAFAFVMPNLNRVRGELEDFAFSVSYVQRLTGLDFFAGLPAAEQGRLERVTRPLPFQ
jgi:endonuclease G